MNEKATKIVEAARSQLGNPYVYGAWGSVCTPNLRRKYAKLNPAHEAAIRRNCPVLSGSKADCTGCKWTGKLAFDCRGFTHWCLLQAGITISGSGATSQYNTVSNWVRRGRLSDMPDVICCLFKQDGSRMMHTGIHIGGGEIIHCSAGVQKGRITDKGWTHYAIPAGIYTEDELTAAGVVTIPPTIKKGATGEAVKQLQAALTQLGFFTGKTDGVFGDVLADSVRSFQRAHALTVDAICGSATWGAIREAMEALQDAPELPPNTDWAALVQQMRDVCTQQAALQDKMAALIEAAAKLHT